MAEHNSRGWHFQSIRHSNARKYGKAGGFYKRTGGAFLTKEDYHKSFNNMLNKRMIERSDKIDFLMKSGLHKREQLEGMDDKTLNEWFVAGLEATGYKHYGKAGGTYLGKYVPQGKAIRKQPTNKRISDDVLRDMYYYRLIWFNVTGESDNNGLFEKFMVSAFPDRKEPSYASEWARRFMTANPTVYMDSIRKKAYMDLLKKDDVYDESLFLKTGTIEDEYTKRLEQEINEAKHKNKK